MLALLGQLAAHSAVTPAQKAAVDLAIAGDNPLNMRLAGRAIIDDLLGRGDLVRVMLNGSAAERKSLFAFKGQSSVLDLNPFFKDFNVKTAAADPRRTLSAAANPNVPPSPEFNPLTVIDPRQQVQLINAMESAQRIQTDDIRAGGTANLLEELLAMLEGYLKENFLFMELNQPEDPYHTNSRVFLSPAGDRPFWSQNRVSGEAIWIENFSELPFFLRERLQDGHLDPARTDGSANIFIAGVAVPVFAPITTGAEDMHEVLEAGLLYVISAFPADRDNLLRLANRLSRFVTSSWRQRQQMHSLVHTDTLTGIRNRSFFDNQFILELERARRSGSSLVLVMGDIDHFKVINDKYGHQVGDTALQAVARELLNGLRRIDIVCRIGGEEFALILPDTELDDARDVVSRIQTRVANLRLSVQDVSEPVAMTISFGGVTFPYCGDSPEELYRKADKMLYLSKEKGRNRCHFWNPEGDPILTLPRII